MHRQHIELLWQVPSAKSKELLFVQSMTAGDDVPDDTWQYCSG